MRPWLAALPLRLRRLRARLLMAVSFRGSDSLSCHSDAVYAESGSAGPVMVRLGHGGAGFSRPDPTRKGSRSVTIGAVVFAARADIEPALFAGVSARGRRVEQQGRKFDMGGHLASWFSLWSGWFGGGVATVSPHVITWDPDA